MCPVRFVTYVSGRSVILAAAQNREGRRERKGRQNGLDDITEYEWQHATGEGNNYGRCDIHALHDAKPANQPNQAGNIDDNSTYQHGGAQSLRILAPQPFSTR